MLIKIAIASYPPIVEVHNLVKVAWWFWVDYPCWQIFPWMGGSKWMGFSKPCLKAYFPDYVFLKKKQSQEKGLEHPLILKPPYSKEICFDVIW